MNYEGLQIAIADTLMRADLATVIPRWIEQAEEGFNQKLRVPEMVKFDLMTLYREGMADLPDDFLEVRTLRYGGRALEFIGIDQLQRAYGQPHRFTVIGRTVKVDAPISSGYLDLYYYQMVPTLTDIAPSNRILRTYPSLYLYGSLIHAAPYLQEDNRLPVWLNIYQQHLESANLQSQQGQYGPAPRIRAKAIG